MITESKISNNKNIMNSELSVCIIDYGLGNIASIKNAFNLLEVNVTVTDKPEVIKKSSHLVLPGVGSFGEGMNNLKKKLLVPVLRDEILKNKKKVLGICLGMQLLATEGFEHGEHKGLNLIPGKVIKIDTSASRLKLPQIGWNDVQLTGKHKITKGFTKTPIFYFVHSFHFVPKDKVTIAGVCDYGESVVAILEKDNITGVQFHPEKSHIDGLKILKNFLN